MVVHWAQEYNQQDLEHSGQHPHYLAGGGAHHQLLLPSHDNLRQYRQPDQLNRNLDDSWLRKIENREDLHLLMLRACCELVPNRSGSGLLRGLDDGSSAIALFRLASWNKRKGPTNHHSCRCHFEYPKHLQASQRNLLQHDQSNHELRKVIHHHPIYKRIVLIKIKNYWVEWPNWIYRPFPQAMELSPLLVTESQRTTLENFKMELCSILHLLEDSPWHSTSAREKS